MVFVTLMFHLNDFFKGRNKNILHSSKIVKYKNLVYPHTSKLSGLHATHPFIKAGMHTARRTDARFAGGSAETKASPVDRVSPGASPGRNIWGGHAWRARGARAYNGGVQAQSPWSEGQGQSPPPLKMKTF